MRLRQVAQEKIILTTERHAVPGKEEKHRVSPNWDGPPFQGDDYQLEYYPDGYPKLPDCLKR